MRTVLTPRSPEYIMKGRQYRHMNETTRTAMLAFAAALLSDPEAVIELRDYGALPDHLADAVADYEMDHEEDDDA